MSEKNLKTRICPICSTEYTEPPALSRKDNNTLICPECGVREALNEAGTAPDVQERIIESMRKAKGNK